MEEKPKLSVIVPFRDRETHLDKFMSHMKTFLDNQKIPFHIFVIEQKNSLPFNKAKLLNIGFKETEHYDYFCFHDIDMLPIESDYSYTKRPTNLASYIEQFNWGLPNDEYFGCALIFTKSSFLRINGCSNNYWGWGGEDDDIWYRCICRNIQPQRKKGKYISLDHKRKVDSSLWKKNYEYLKTQEDMSIRLEIMKEDGLSSLSYTKIKEEKINEYTTKIITTFNEDNTSNIYNG